MYVLQVHKRFAELYLNEIKIIGVLEKTLLLDEDGIYLYIPLSRELGKEELKKLDMGVHDTHELIKINQMENIEISSCSQIERKSLKRKYMKMTPYDKVVARCMEFGFPEHLSRAVPRKWERFGEILVIRVQKVLREYETMIAEAFVEVLGVSAVYADDSGIEGELRTPRLRCLAGTKSVTTHLENGIRYKFDVTGIMFSSGNIDERVHFSRFNCSGETVVDMFAGIGYFSLPLAVYGGPLKIHAIEKNPLSFRYMKTNIANNRVQKIIDPILGDNREVGPTGIADRVIMGYLPSAINFIPRALEFLKSSGGIIHFHYTCRKEERKIKVDKTFKDVTSERGWYYELKEIRVIKSYAPFIYHCVADVFVGVNDGKTTFST
ncbi:MAG: class I SAM-dependent methyltransferase family protein [Candidatus Thermoplasmatota archaeon]|nr:class I SAM-dependent methyltransferase family protein [Candidatus Thermoplasmatota archaeon]MDP7265490.1 class I SAM-dependent methyltransferase family protein [Candidatus Thermoplasmatota archaeon]